MPPLPCTSVILRALFVLTTVPLLTLGQVEQAKSLPAKSSSADPLSSSTLDLQKAELAGDKLEIAKALNRLGDVFSDKGKIDEALKNYEKSLELWEGSTTQVGMQAVLNSLAYIYFDKNDLAKTYEFASRSLAVATTFNDETVIAKSLSRLGNVDSARGDYEKALEKLQRALAICRRLNDPGMISSALNGIARAYQRRGLYVETLASLEESLHYSELAGDKEGEAIELCNIGSTYETLGDYSKAMTSYRKSLDISHEIDSPDDIAAATVNIAHLYIEQDNVEQAAALYADARSIFEKVGNKDGLAYSLTGLANTSSEQGSFSRAIDYEQQALALWTELDLKEYTTRCFINLGDFYNDFGDKRKAAEFYKRPVVESEQFRDNELIFEAHLVFAGFYQSEKSYAKAIEETSLAKLAFEKVSGKGEDWELYKTLGEAYRGIGKRDEARENYDHAISIIEGRRNRSFGGHEEQQNFFAGKVHAYDLMVDLLESEGKSVQALLYAERSKSRALVDALRYGGDAADKRSTNAEKVQERALRTELVSLNARISKESAVDPAGAVRLAELRTSLDKKRLEFENFQVGLYSAHPELRIQRGEMKPVGLEEAVQLLPDAMSALLEFVVTDDKSFLFVITRDAAKAPTLKTYSIEVGRKEIAVKIEKYRSALAAGDLGFSKQARELYDLFLKSAEPQLAGKKSLTIVPDGPLWDLPFQALQNRQGKYLLEQAAVSYAPSLTALQEMKKRAKGARTRLELLAFGNPIVGKETAERVGSVFMGEKLDPLPEAERLVTDLGKMYGPNRSKVYIGADAREETAKIEAPKYRIVQFATHGILNNVSPMYSHLVMAQNDKNPDEDGLLEAWEMKDLDLHADLVILSACDTARGKISNGEGMIGMTWAMFIAGTPTTVASQWKVESSSTTELMLEFHRQLLSGKNISKAEALRLASLKVMKMPKYQHPSYWAGFVLVGDGN